MMEFSLFGKKMTCHAGILSLMDDLGDVHTAKGEGMIMMGGGNPGYVPEFQKIMRARLKEICDDTRLFQRLAGTYAPARGDHEFVEGLVALLRKDQGWDVGPENICLTNGSQTAFFLLFNMFSGAFSNGRTKKICLPLVPEYIGYADLGLTEDCCVSIKPEIEFLDGDMFKYHIDFDQLVIGEDVGAICVSRPTNPTGNVVTDRELEKLSWLAREKNIPLIIDSAYGLPFPGMIYTEARPTWNDNSIVCLSLSKLGLPGIRTGIVVAGEEIIKALGGMNAIMSLSPTSVGGVLTEQLVSSGEITTVSRELIQPFYLAKRKKAVAAVREAFGDIPCKIHKPEGAMFLWLWFENLPITSLELYGRLKNRGVLVVSGHYFFPGLDGDWKHRDECLRVTYSQNDEDVYRGIGIIAEEVGKAYAQAG